MRALLLAVLVTAPAAAQEVRFRDMTQALPGPPHEYSGGWEHFVGGGVAVMDCNGDRQPDIFAAGGAAPARLFVNAVQGADWAFDAGALAEITGVTGAYPLDIDGDGHVDLVVLRVGENMLLRGDGACGFSRTNEAWGFDGGDRWTTAFSATWQAGNDRPTLAFGNYVDRADPDGPFMACDANELHRPVPGGWEITPLEPGFCALSMLFSDYDRDGVAELRVSNDRHYYVRGGTEQMWELDPLRELVATGAWAPLRLWGMGIASQDLTGDGHPEVMLTSMGDQQLMIFEDGAYRRAPLAWGTYATRPHAGGDGRPSTGWHADFADVNNDGLPDLFIAKGNVDQMPGMAMEDPNNLLLQQPDGTFVERAAAAGIASTARSRGAAFADFDGDGRLDLVVVNRRAPLELWRNTSEVGPAISLHLDRTGGPNSGAVGALVEWDHGGRRTLVEQFRGGGHVSGAAVGLHLGHIEGLRLRVLWPGSDRWTDWYEPQGPGRHVARYDPGGAGADRTVFGPLGPPCPGSGPIADAEGPAAIAACRADTD